ncbi:thioesterase domain-containing protein [Sarocladium implicatum]|nr:thioesterase domain-containing protein [Sarocladium implicatum]
MAPIDELLAVVAEEMGMDSDELTDDTDVTELARESPLLRMVLKRIPDSLKGDIDATTFRGCDDVADLKERISKIPGSQESNAKAQKSSPNEPPKQLVLLLQGNPASATKKVFLLPDGSGAGMAYMAIPPLDPEVCLYGINSPYLHATEDFKGSFDDLIPRWAGEIRGVQPKGPYTLGGWSAGGYFSFELAKLFMEQGEEVEKLILIDSPCRLEFEALPTKVVEYLARNNLMGNWSRGGTPQWLVNSFTATIGAVEKYMPTPMRKPGPSGYMPAVFIIWASEGALREGEAQAHPELDLSTKVGRFLVEPRREFGPIGWDKLFPNMTLMIEKIPGNHFMIVHPPFVVNLGERLRDAVLHEDGTTQLDWEYYGADFDERWR